MVRTMFGRELYTEGKEVDLLSGTTSKHMYSTPQAKAAHNEKKKTTGSVARNVKGVVRER